MSQLPTTYQVAGKWIYLIGLALVLGTAVKIANDGSVFSAVLIFVGLICILRGFKMASNTDRHKVQGNGRN